VKGAIYQLIYLAEALLTAGRLRRLEVDHIHNHFGDHSGLVTMLAARLIGAEYSISIHGPHVFMDQKYAAFKEKIDNAQFVRCISYFCRSQAIIFSESTDISKFKVVHCGLDLQEYAFRAPRQQVKRLFCAARLSHEKGIEFLVHALAILARRGYALELRLAGDGPQRDVLERLAADLGVSRQVTFLGNLREAQVTRELTESDIFVLPSLAEGVPVSLMEAMAVGVPVIATNIAGTSELVEDGKNGILVRPTDAEALGDAVAEIISDYDLRLRTAKEGRAKVGKEFDIDVETAKLRTYLSPA
jgi:glycosyltransferase involved in cell wall biosynthesis